MFTKTVRLENFVAFNKELNFRIQERIDKEMKENYIIWVIDEIDRYLVHLHENYTKTGDGEYIDRIQALERYKYDFRNKVR